MKEGRREREREKERSRINDGELAETVDVKVMHTQRDIGRGGDEGERGFTADGHERVR